MNCKRLYFFSENYYNFIVMIHKDLETRIAMTTKHKVIEYFV